MNAGIANGWRQVRIGDYISTLTDYHANGSYKKLKDNVELLDTPDYAVMIRTTNFEKYDFRYDLKYISESAYHFLHKSKVKPGDILMNKIANAGSVYYMPDLGRPVSLAMNLFLIRTNGEEANQRFVYYYLKANEPYIKQFAVGTAATTITKEAVRNLEILLPPIDLQHKIANVLYSLDRLIEIHKRRSDIYEEMLQSLFKAWFVSDQSGSVEKTNSIIGYVSDKWERMPLTDLVEFVKGIEPGSEHYLRENADETVAFLRVRDLNSKSNDVFILRSLAMNKLLTKDDIAITLDGTVGIVRVGLEGCYSSGIRKAVIKYRELITSSFLYCLLKADYIQKTIKTHAKGTTILHAGTAINHMFVVLPDSDYMNLFDKHAAPLLKSIIVNQDKMAILSHIRDYLMPRLTSGEIDVSDIANTNY